MTEDITLSIPSHPKYLPLVRNVTERVSLEAGLSELEATRMVLALDETCSNIIRHSCGIDSSLALEISFTITEAELQMSVRDFGECGKNFDLEEQASKEAREQAEEEVTPGGFGVSILKKIMDSVHYCSTPEEGNCLTMIKKIN